jgi:hypothetical protein
VPQRFSAVLAEKAPVEHPRLVLRFETEARIEFLAEPLVAPDDRLPLGEQPTEQATYGSSDSLERRVSDDDGARALE